MHGHGMGWGFGGADAAGGRGGRWQMRELAKQEHWDWPVVRRMLRAFRPYLRRALLVSVVILLTSAGGAVPAWLTQRIIDDGISRGDIHRVLLWTGVLIGTALITGLLGVLQNWLTSTIAQSVMADYRMALFRHLQQQSVLYFASRQTGDLVSRIMNDVTAIQTVITSTLVGLVSNLLTIATTLVLMLELNWQLTVLAILIVPAFVLPTQQVGKRRQALQAQIQQWLSRMTVQLGETLGVSGALLVRMFGHEPVQEAAFAEANDTLRRLQVRQALVGRWLFMWLGMFSSIGPAILWGYGGWLVIQHRIGLGVIVAFTALLSRLYGPLSQLAQLHVNILASIALFRRIFALLDQPPEITDGPLVLVPERLRGRIELRQVWFAYPHSAQREGHAAIHERRWALQDVRLTVEPGQTVALVGPSGAGKSTLLQLIPRLTDPTRGQVLLDGVDIRSYTLASLRSQMGLVPQDPFFFHDTVFNNLRVAKPDATLEEMEQACRAAQIHDTIAALPEGYHTVVGERGYRLSGGERQRLAIARVLLRGARIVLLDEATSALDSVVEREIQHALEVLLEGRTAIVIAHRLSTVLRADQIIVLDHGRIVASGTHAELLETSPLYHTLYETQFAVT
ncbi:MAG: ABC transporter ATP-binding protein [Thermoflavifilum sp.]|nr:ABC transporter ATP-binding protein [Thermoflavifilum sp.]MCL6514256.1 ABC transporter ATP-binding protein/permease [Alicyclobacillus sp.]